MKHIKAIENTRGVDLVDTETLATVAVFGFLDDEEREYAGYAIVMNDDYTPECYADDFVEFVVSKTPVRYEVSDFTTSNLHDYLGLKYFEIY